MSFQLMVDTTQDEIIDRKHLQMHWQRNYGNKMPPEADFRGLCLSYDWFNASLFITVI
jgi:hypothetical protein